MKEAYEKQVCQLEKLPEELTDLYAPFYDVIRHGVKKAVNTSLGAPDVVG
jgi:hypothetical protein